MVNQVAMTTDPCPCGSPFPQIRVIGRTDDILLFRATHGETIHILPLAIATVAEATAGVASCRLIQRGPANLTVRFTATSPREKPEVWDRLRRRLGTYLGEQGASDVTIEEASEQPQLHPTSGKFRQVYSDCPRWLGCERRHGRRTTARRQAGEFTVRIGAIRGYASPERRQVELVRDSSVLGRFG